MMRSSRWTAVTSAAILAVCGCGGSGNGSKNDDQSSARQTAAETPSVASVESDGRSPQQVVKRFLEGLRRGDREQVLGMLTPAARESGVVNPEASSDAMFEVGQVTHHGDDIAYVECTWQLADSEDVPDEAVWALRREPEGWRVAGTIMKVYELGGEMVPLDFEKPEQMEEMQLWVAEEIARRSRGPEQMVGSEETGRHYTAEFGRGTEPNYVEPSDDHAMSAPRGDRYEEEPLRPRYTAEREAFENGPRR